MKLRIRFTPPGMFMTDATVVVSLDGNVVHQGSFLLGFDLDTHASVGSHTLETAVRLGLVTRRRSFTFAVPEQHEGDQVLDVRLGYDNVWGNFRKHLEIAQSTADAVREENSHSQTPPAPQRRPVRATWVLLCVLALCYAGELLLPVTPSRDLSPSVPTLIALGGLLPRDVAHGDWYRMLSCVFLHAGAMHLLMNGVALAMVGVLVEGLLGWRWFLALFFVGGLGGSGMSLALNDGQTVSVGASGAIMALFAAGLFIAQTLPTGTRGRVQGQLLRVLLPSLIPVVPHGGERVDIGAHLGGAIVGAIAGAVILRAFRRTQAGPSSTQSAVFADSRAAFIVAMAFVLGSAFALVGVVTRAYPQTRTDIATEQALLPNDQLPSDAPTAEQVNEWLRRYPDDPRVCIFAARLAIDRDDFDAASAHIAHGRSVLRRYGTAFSNPTLFANALSELERDVALDRELVPNRDWPSGTDEQRNAAWSSHFSEWLARYPNDPRVRQRAAWDAIVARRYADAEQHARIGAAQWPRFANRLEHSNTLSALRYARALALRGLGRTQEAAPLIDSICSGSDGTEIAHDATQDGLCAARDQ